LEGPQKEDLNLQGSQGVGPLTREATRQRQKEAGSKQHHLTSLVCLYSRRPTQVQHKTWIPLHWGSHNKPGRQRAQAQKARESTRPDQRQTSLTSQGLRFMRVVGASNRRLQDLHPQQPLPLEQATTQKATPCWGQVMLVFLGPGKMQV